MKGRRVWIVTLLALITVISGFAQPLLLSSPDQPTAGQHPGSSVLAGPTTPLSLNISLNAAGATFPQPLIARWATEYHATHSNVTINYLSVGSGSGQNRFINKTVDFAASDAPLNSGQRILAPNTLHIPESIGSVVAAFNLPGIPTGLNFTDDVLANIYLGNIVNWNDPAIQSLNPHTTLPTNPISVAHRSDSSGTTFVWTSYLCLSNTPWCTTVGKGTIVLWPVGTGASGNGGVATFIKNTPFALGYVELNYALGNAMTYGAVQNPAGQFIVADLTTTANAVNNFALIGLPAGNGDWSNVALLNALGPNSYSIASFTYFLVYKELNIVPSMNNIEGAQAKELVKFLNWVITTGQTFSNRQDLGLYYVPLPSRVVTIDQTSINSITYTTTPAPLQKSFTLRADSILGWNLTQPGPTLSVTSGDTVTLNLISNDAGSHQWWIDFASNNVVDPNETASLSPSFTTTTTFSFTPLIWLNLPSAGTFTYKDVNHPTLTGTILVFQQQVATPLIQPSSSLTTSSRPVIDSSRISTIGSVIFDTRRQTFSANITVVTVDKTSGSLTFAKAYLLTNTNLFSTLSLGLKRSRFLLNEAVLPYALSSNILVEYSVSGSTITARASVNSVTRNVDIASNGIVSIVDVGIVFAQFGRTSADPTFNPKADLLGEGAVTLTDASIAAVNFGAQAFS